MPVFLSPLGNGFQFLDEVGQPLNSGLLYTYLAGTSTPQPTFTTVNGNVENDNPIVLNTDGRPPNDIWFSQGITYDFALHDADDNLIRTYDDLPGINDVNLIDGDLEVTGDIIGAPQWLQFAIMDQDSALTTGLKFTSRLPACTVQFVRASLKTASTSGAPVFDIKKNGTTILSTKITIDQDEKTSTTATTPPVISVPTFADDDEITFHIDTAGTNAVGPLITMKVKWTN